MTSLIRSLLTVLRHRWMDDTHARRALPPTALARLKQRVSASEERHSGQIRIAVEAGLPMSYLWRHLRRRVPLRQIVRERALMQFGKLRVWDTAHNNGVLIYLLLAERAIEIVGDRGLNPLVTAADWQALLARMRPAFREGRFEDGLGQAVDEVSAMLLAGFPKWQDSGGANDPGNELPDAPVVL